MARTIIGSTIAIDGTIDGEPAVVVQGSVKGAIHGASEVSVEKGAEVEAEIDTDVLSVAGKLRGKVTAKSKVSIGPEGKMVGDIRSPRILIADGAQFKGNIDME
jgi:cytoskeletal protein CcmA (bactofilin family)